MAVGPFIKNLFVLTLIGSFAYTVYPLPVNSVLEHRSQLATQGAGCDYTSKLEAFAGAAKHPFWQPQCRRLSQQRHRRSPKQVQQVLNIVIHKLNQTFHKQIRRIYGNSGPLKKFPRYSWLPRNPGKKMKEANYAVFYTKLQEYAVILHILNRTTAPAGYDPDQFKHAERQSVINSIANMLKQLLCEIEYTMKGKLDHVKCVNLQKFENVIPSNLNQTELHVYDLVTFNSYKKFLASWKKVLQKARRNNRKKKTNGKTVNPKKDPEEKRKKVVKVTNGSKPRKNKKVAAKQKKQQPK